MKLKRIRGSLESIDTILNNEEDKHVFLPELLSYLNEGPYAITYSNLVGYMQSIDYYFKWNPQNSLVYFTTERFVKGINILEVGIPKRNDNQIEWAGHNISSNQLIQFNCTLFYLQCFVALIKINTHHLSILTTIIESCRQDMEDYAKQLSFKSLRDLSDVIAYRRLSSVFDNPTHITAIYEKYCHDRTVVPPVVTPNKEEDAEITESVIRHRNQLIKMHEISEQIKNEQQYNRLQYINNI